MTTALRQEVNLWHERVFAQLGPEVKDVLDVGIAGDPYPGGNFDYFRAVNYVTLDVDPLVEPTYVADICDTKLPDAQFDCIILSQVLEHVWEPHKAIAESHRMLRPGGWLIIDVPWMYEYHPEAPAFDDYWRFSAAALSRMLEAFSDAGVQQSEIGSYAWARK